MEKSVSNSPSGHGLLQGIKTLLGRLRQHPDIYPIKYYKKAKRFRRNWQAPLVK